MTKPTFGGGLITPDLFGQGFERRVRRAIVRRRQSVGPGVGQGFSPVGLARVAGLEPFVFLDVDEDAGEAAVLGDEHRGLAGLLDIEPGASLEFRGGYWVSAGRGVWKVESHIGILAIFWVFSTLSLDLRRAALK